MRKDIEVSIVMSVYNGAQTLRQTVDSVLSQEGVNLEFIIVNDGSTDESPDILKGYSEKGSNLKIIHQDNMGLTKSLINGCASAHGIYIARQDAGDVSLPGRLRKQVDLFEKNADAALVSCGTRFVGPKNEYLYDVVQEKGDATTYLRTLNIKDIRGPSHHGSTMFLRAAYEKAGGYRSAFPFAQDLDLWIRLAEIGRHFVIPKVLYQALITPDSISCIYSREQFRLKRLIIDASRKRAAGYSDEEVLKSVKPVEQSKKYSVSRVRQARSLYFIASCLQKRDQQKAKSYFKKALKAYPMHIKSWFKLLGLRGC